MTWTDVSDTTNGNWVAGSGGTSATWSTVGSDTTTRNTSRFVLLNRSTGSVRGGVDFAVHLRSENAGARGVGFLITTNDPVRLHESGDSLI